VSDIKHAEGHTEIPTNQMRKWI